MPPVILEADQRLSQSLLWDIQRQFFLQQGITAWRQDIVPHYISSNPVMARAYAQVVLGYLRDCYAERPSGFSLTNDQPIYIIELGSGSGRLAYHFLHQFFPHWAQSPYTDIPIKLIMTDFVPDLLDFWQNHPRLQPWIEQGLLDFALFDVENPQALTLVNANLTLTPAQLCNPIIFLANYFFDSIPQDSFVLEDGLLCQNLLTLYSSQLESNLTDPTIWERLKLAYEAIPLAEPAYEIAAYNDILADYEACFPDTRLLFPNGALDCIRFWQGFGNGRCLLLSSDRGHTLEESLISDDDPLPNLHGSFSWMVNYHAINQFITMQDGLALHANHYQNSLQVVAYLLGDLPQNGKETSLAFNSAILQGGPDDFFALKQVIENHYHEMDLPQLLSYLRLSGWDADILEDCLPALHAQTEQVDEVWYPDIALAIQQVWQNYFSLGEKENFVSQITALLEKIGYPSMELEPEHSSNSIR